MIDTNLSNFVGVFENALSVETCQEIIDYFEECDRLKLTVRGCSGGPGNVDVNVKESTDLQLLYPSASVNPFWTPTVKPESYRRIHDEMLAAFIKCTIDYAKNMASTINASTPFDHNELKITSMQVQRYLKQSVGYPKLHVEDDSPLARRRVFAPLLYLNDIEVGGETEIPLAGMKVKPKAGTIMIIPCGLPFWHKGNPSPEKDKYIVTSWVEHENETQLANRLIQENIRLQKAAVMPNMHVNPFILSY